MLRFPKLPHELPSRMQIVAHCDLLGWDYEKYMNQPKWFVDLTIAKRAIDKRHSTPQP